MKRPILDRVQSVVEYLLAVPFMLSAIVLPFAEPLGTKGFVVLFLGGKVALIVYAIWFAFISIGLIYSKIRCKRRAHLNFLMCIYLTVIYTSVLTWYIAGFATAIDDIIIGILAGVCWLRWKFRIYYLEPGHYYKDGHETF